MTTAQTLSIILVLLLAIVAFAYISTAFSQTNQIDSLQNQLNALREQVSSGQSNLTSIQGNISGLQSKLSSLPVMNEKPTVRNIKVEWTNTVNSGQDRFFLPMITVNQGDMLDITFVSNDTDAHTFTMESPYNFQINATVPGTRDYLKNGSLFTTAATGNSLGVKVWGTPGNVTGTGSFVAKYAGIYEYFCIYHVQLGMFGYLVVLPNEAYNGSQPANSGGTTSSNAVHVSIAQGSATNTTSPGFTPSVITVVIGINNTVVWTNDDSFPHTVTANDGLFSSGNLNPSDTFSWTFTAAGTYSYHCSYHPWMNGTVIVKSS